MNESDEDELIKLNDPLENKGGFLLLSVDALIMDVVGRGRDSELATFSRT